MFCRKSKENDQRPLQKSDDVIDDGIYRVPQRIRVLCYSKARLVLKMTAVVCGQCLTQSDKDIINAARDLNSVKARAMSEHETLPKRWKERYNESVRALLSAARDRDDLKVQNAELEQNQKTQWDVTRPYRRINVNLHVTSTRLEYMKKKTESEEKWSQLDTNRHDNFISYWKMSDMDCFTLCHNTRKQIAEMAEHCQLSEEMIFFWWHRFYRKCSFSQQSIVFGVSASALKQMWRVSTDKLRRWAKQYLIHDGDDSSQFWTEERIQANTTNMARELHDPLNEGRVIVVMDGTYIYTECIQTDHEIRQHLWSQHKNSTLVKPHLTVCTNGKIIHGGDVFWANVCGSDTNIYRSMTDVFTLRRFEANPNAADCPFSPRQIRELLYFNKIWGHKGIAICDNGYKLKDARIRKPKDVGKNKRGSTLASHWKRTITMVRQVTERVNMSLKKWKMIGDGKVRASEVASISDYVTIAMGHHNKFSCVYQEDHVDNAVQLKRLLEMRTVIENPCARYWIPKPPRPRKKKNKNGSQAPRPQLPPPPPFDDGFKLLAQGLDKVQEWLKHCDWLQHLRLTDDDGQDLVGRQFQHRLCHRYIKFLSSNFKLKVHKVNQYVLRFENLKSKYQSSKHRTVLVNFTHVVRWRERTSSNDQNRNHNANVVHSNVVTEHDVSGVNPTTPLKEKKWENLNFSLWQTDLARLQYYCVCNAGAQMVNPCAHVSASIYLVIWTMTNCLQQRIRMSARDERIRESVTNLRPLLDRWKSQETLNKRHGVQLYCRCNQPFHGFMVQCPGCEEHFHPECIGTTEGAIMETGIHNFKCPTCDPFSILFKVKEPEEEVSMGMVPALQSVSDNETSMNVDDVDD